MLVAVRVCSWRGRRRRTDLREAVQRSTTLAEMTDAVNRICKVRELSQEAPQASRRRRETSKRPVASACWSFAGIEPALTA